MDEEPQTPDQPNDETPVAELESHGGLTLHDARESIEQLTKMIIDNSKDLDAQKKTARSVARDAAAALKVGTDLKAAIAEMSITDPAPTRSAEIGDLAASLALAQGAFPSIKQSGRNPHFDSTYANIDDILTAVRPALAENGICITMSGAVGTNEVTVTATLAHSSGQWLSAEMVVPALDPKGRFSAHSIAAACTYAQRFNLQLLLCVAGGSEDDGNHASGKE